MSTAPPVRSPVTPVTHRVAECRYHRAGAWLTGAGATFPPPATSSSTTRSTKAAWGQYVAWRPGDQTMIGQIDGILARQDLGKLQQWPYAEFLPLIHHFDTLFEEQGWLTRTKL